MSASIRGDKSHVRIIRNGQPELIYSITGMDVTENSQTIQSYYAGQTQSETDVLMMGFSGSIQVEVKNDGIDVLIDAVRAARNSGSAVPQVTITVYEEYPDGALDGSTGKGFLYTDVQLTLGGSRLGGATEKLTKSLNFTCSDKVLIP